MAAAQEEPLRQYPVCKALIQFFQPSHLPVEVLALDLPLQGRRLLEVLVDLVVAGLRMEVLEQILGLGVQAIRLQLVRLKVTMAVQVG